MSSPISNETDKDEGSSDLSKYRAISISVKDDQEIDRVGNTTGNNRTASLSQIFGFSDDTDRAMMMFGTISAVITGSCLPAFCVIFGRLLDALNRGGSIITAVSNICIIFVCIGALNFFSGFSQVYCWSIAGTRQAHRFRVKYVNSVLSQEIGWFDSIGPSELNTLVTELTGQVQDGITRRVGELFQFGSQFLVSFIAAFVLCWELSLVLIATLPLIALSGAFLIKAVTASQFEASDQYAKAGGVATQSLGAIRTVAALNAQPFFISEYRKFIIEAMNIGILKSFKVGLGNGMTFGVSFLTYALGFWYGARLIILQTRNNCTHNCYTGGTIIAVFFCVIIGATSLGQMTPPLTAFFTAKAAAYTMIQTIERTPLIDGLSEEGDKPEESPKGLIEVKDVQFSYPSRPHVSVCNGYTLSIQPGETVALCGPSGAGKSTLINLLLRFYDPSSGVISLDGKNIKDLNIKWLRNHIGYVGQEPVLFAGTVEENIAFGIDREVDSELTDEEIHTRVVEAAKLANAHGFISAFPLGYLTEVGGNGLSLSGGQKQRIAIARALVKKPAVLLLDEATSALDAASEKLVQKSIDQLQQSKSQTTIVIAHRLSTIRNADKIAVINGGRVVELGTHEHLLRLNGLYADLVKIQMSSAEDELALNKEALLRSDDMEALEQLALEQAEAAEAVTSELKKKASGGKSPKKLNDKQLRQLRIQEAKNEEISKEEAKDLRWRLLRMIGQYWHWMGLGLVGAAMVGASFPLWGLILAEAQNMFYLSPHELQRQSSIVSTRFVFLAIDCFIGYTLEYYCVGQVGHRIVTTLRSDLFESFFRREVGFFDQEANAVGVLTANLAEDSRLVHESTAETFTNQLQAVFTLIVGLVIGFSASWKISLVVLATFPLNILAATFRSKERTGQQGSGSNDEDTYSGPLSSAFIHMRTISAFSMQKRVGETYAAATKEVSLDREARSVYDGIGLGFTNAMLFFSYALLFWYGSHLVANRQITFRNLLTAILGLMLGSLGLGQALNDIGDQKQGLLAARRIFSHVDAASHSAIDGLSTKGVVASLPGQGDSRQAAGRIELKNVQFHYPTRPEVQVCQDYNLTISEGEFVALVGPSGSGKSTIMNLLLRFYDPIEGQILLDGVDIKDLNIRWLRSQIGYVGQEPVLFTGTISDNIAKGRASMEFDTVRPLSDFLTGSMSCMHGGRYSPTSDEVPAATTTVRDIETGALAQERGHLQAPDDVVTAARMANADEFIRSFTEQYATDVGESSALVSGGQKQRIAIARALIKRPRILLLDEATSALDAASEALVQQSIDALMQSSQTTVVIAHRLSTIRGADKIAVIDGGRVVEVGRHDDLIARNGLYAQLWSKQSGGDGGG